MTLTIDPELGVPLNEGESNPDLKNQVEAASNTALELAEHGLDITPTKEDKDVAAKLADLVTASAICFFSKSSVSIGYVLISLLRNIPKHPERLPRDVVIKTWVSILTIGIWPDVEFF